MALDADQKAEVRRYMGYSDQSAGVYSLLEGSLASLSAAAEGQVETVLEDLAVIEEQLRTSWARQKVHVAEDVTLAGHDEIIALRKEGRRLCGVLSIITGVELGAASVFGGGTSGVAGRA